MPLVTVVPEQESRPVHMQVSVSDLRHVPGAMTSVYVWSLLNTLLHVALKEEGRMGVQAGEGRA